MARPQFLLLLQLAILLAVVAIASADAPAPVADDHTPSITDPVAHSPVTDYVDPDEDMKDLEDDDDAAPVGSPLGTTMRPPEKDSNSRSGGTSILPGIGTSSQLAVVSVLAAYLASGLVF